MGTGFSEAPLAVFTTLAPMGACAFAIIACAFLAVTLDDESAKRLDKMTLLPLAVMLAGFIGAFFHLANPLAALGVVAGIGRSPLTNEIMVGGLFLVAAIVYWALARAGKLSLGARKAFLIVLAVWSVVFAAFCGLAYMIGTVPSWNTPWTGIQMIGYGLLGGSVLGALVLRLAQVKAGRIPLALAVCGLALSLIGFGGQIAAAGSMSNIWGSAQSLVPAAWGIFAALAICGIVGVAIQYADGKKHLGAAAFGCACFIVAIGVFFARIGFYGMFMSVAL